jgi:uncharacterized membrane protein
MEANPATILWRTTSPTSAIALPAVALVKKQAAELQLTDTQVKSLVDLLNKVSADLNGLRNTSREANEALHNALCDSSKDMAAVQTLMESAQKADAAVANLELSTWAQIRKILTADQLEKLGEARGIAGVAPGSLGEQKSNSQGAETAPPAPPVR